MTAAAGSQPQLKSEIKGVSALPNGTPSNSPLQFPSSHFRLVFQGRCWFTQTPSLSRSPLNHWWILIKHACAFHLHFAGAFTQSVNQTHDVRYECRFPHCKNEYIILKSYIPEWMQSYYTVKKLLFKVVLSMFYWVSTSKSYLMCSCRFFTINLWNLLAISVQIKSWIKCFSLFLTSCDGHLSAHNDRMKVSAHVSGINYKGQKVKAQLKRSNCIHRAWWE